MSVYVGAHHFHGPNSCQVDLASFDTHTPGSLATALIPTNGHAHFLSAFSSSTILVIGSGRDRLQSVPVARIYTSQFCREIVRCLETCHNVSIDVSVTYNSELYYTARRQMVQIPKTERRERLEDGIIDRWFLINELTRPRSAHIVCCTY